MAQNLKQIKAKYLLSRVKINTLVPGNQIVDASLGEKKRLSTLLCIYYNTYQLYHL